MPDSVDVELEAAEAWTAEGNRGRRAGDLRGAAVELECRATRIRGTAAGWRNTRGAVAAASYMYLGDWGIGTTIHHCIQTARRARLP